MSLIICKSNCSLVPAGGVIVWSKDWVNLNVWPQETFWHWQYKRVTSFVIYLLDEITALLLHSLHFICVLLIQPHCLDELSIKKSGLTFTL